MKSALLFYIICSKEKERLGRGLYVGEILKFLIKEDLIIKIKTSAIRNEQRFAVLMAALSNSCEKM